MVVVVGVWLGVVVVNVCRFVVIVLVLKGVSCLNVVWVIGVSWGLKV